jgi:hypothetical protein
MSMIFAYRSSQLDAFLSQSGKVFAPRLGDNTVAAIALGADASAIGGQVLLKAHATKERCLGFIGQNNWPSTNQLAVLLRIIPRFTGNPAANVTLFQTNGDINGSPSGAKIFIDTFGRLIFNVYDQYGALIGALTKNSALGLVSGTAVDLFISWDGTINAGALKINVNGVTTDQGTNGSALTARNNLAAGPLLVGPGTNANFDLNELVIWDDAVDPLTLGLGAARSTFVTATAFDGQLIVDPGVKNVRKNVVYTLRGVNYTGSLFVPDPDVQRISDDKPIAIKRGETVQFVVPLRTKDGNSPIYVGKFSEIVAKFLKADNTSLQLRLSTGEILVDEDEGCAEIFVNLSATNSALLALADSDLGQDLGSFEIITTGPDGDVVIYDYKKALLVQDPLLP